MPERIKQEDPVEAFSLSGLWRTTMVQFEVYRDRPAPVCAFLLALATWGAAGYRLYKPELASPTGAGVCLGRDVLFVPAVSEWRRYALHALWPLEPGYIRSFFTGTALIIHGYALEYEVGTFSFGAFMVGLHVAAAALLLHFQFVGCFISQESMLAALAVVMHRVNPQIHTDGVDKSLRVPFPVEPRWHIWIIQAVLLLFSYNFPVALAFQAAGIIAGAVPVIRDPCAWQDAWASVRTRSFGIGAIVHVGLLIFTVLFMPLSASDIPVGWVSAILDGRAFRGSWWTANVPATAPLLHMALLGTVAGEALFICKLMIAFMIPLILSPFKMWARFYAVGCVLLAMYAMNSEEWRYPHIGFITLVYLAWAFWKLPNMPFAKEHYA